MRLSIIFSNPPIQINFPQLPLLKDYLESNIFRSFVQRTSIGQKYPSAALETEAILPHFQNIYLHCFNYWLTHQERLGKGETSPFILHLPKENISQLSTSYAPISMEISAIKTKGAIYQQDKNSQKEFEGFIQAFLIATTSQLISYLILKAEICSPLDEVISQKQIDSSIERINNHLLNIPRLDPAFQQTLKTSPIHFSQNGTNGINNLSKAYTNQELFKVQIYRHSNRKKQYSPVEVFSSESNCLRLYDIVKTALSRKPDILSSKIILLAAAQNRAMATHFNPLVLFEILQYIHFKTQTKAFDAHPEFLRFYDPCGGWGERQIAAYLSCYFNELYVNDFNKDLKVPYEGIHSQLQKIPVKKIGLDPSHRKQPIQVHYTFEDALTLANPAVLMDFCFSGLPFFDKETYNVEQTQKNMNADSWVDNWAFPLIKKLLNQTAPGGYVILNLGKDMNSIDLVKILEKKIKLTPETKAQITENSLYNTDQLFYAPSKKIRSSFLLFQKESRARLLPSLRDNQLLIKIEASVSSGSSEQDKPRLALAPANQGLLEIKAQNSAESLQQNIKQESVSIEPSFDESAIQTEQDLLNTSWSQSEIASQCLIRPGQMQQEANLTQGLPLLPLQLDFAPLETLFHQARSSLFNLYNQMFSSLLTQFSTSFSQEYLFSSIPSFFQVRPSAQPLSTRDLASCPLKPELNSLPFNWIAPHQPNATEKKMQRHQRFQYHAHAPVPLQLLEKRPRFNTEPSEDEEQAADHNELKRVCLNPQSAQRLEPKAELRPNTSPIEQNTQRLFGRAHKGIAPFSDPKKKDEENHQKRFS